MKCQVEVLATTILTAVLVAGCSKEEPPQQEVVRPVKAIKVYDEAGFVVAGSLPGRAKATQELELSFRVDGPLVARPVNVGDEVKKGGLIARIDERDYQVRLRNAEGQLQRALANEERAKADYERNLSIQRKDPGAISQAAIDRTKENLDIAKADIAAFEAEVDAAKDALSYATLRAPFEGTIVATYVENYEDVRAKQPIVRMVDSSKIEMVVNLPENYISYAPHVKKVRVDFDAFPDRPLEATVKEIGTEASQTTRTYPITLIMEQPEDFKILPGMAGRSQPVDFKLPQNLEETGLEIPVAAVFSDDATGKSYVWVIDEGTRQISRRELETGALTNTGIQILKGLEPGEWIATAGVNTLREGQEVSILNDPEES
ncbi:MAG: efflux RND transporter periplasmic adaptor subunit [Desulfobacterales bacterium]|nr:efflux RND transporter periplasmic adaptor subunit [Desulfobacterales bacterium]